MTDVQRQQLDEAEGAAPFITRARPLRMVPATSEEDRDWRVRQLETRLTLAMQTMGERVNRLEIEVTWLRRELEQAKGEAQ